MPQIEFLQKKICQEIPLLEKMGIQIQSIDNNFCLLSAPLEPNHNHKGTAFGGSLYAACTAACYTLIYHRQLQSQITDRDLVITDGQMKYKKPVKTDFSIRAELIESQWQSLLESLRNKRPEKLIMTCFVYSAINEIACEFKAHFALLPSDRR